MKKVVRLTESDLVRIVKKVINEQSTTFYGDLNTKGYEMVKDWKNKFSDDKRLFKDIEKSLILFKPNENSVVFFSKDIGPTKTIKFITNGTKLYFLNNGGLFTNIIFPKELKTKYSNPDGPFEIRDIKKYL
jgi:hypothetical protein